MSVETINPPQTMLEVYESLPEGTRVQLIQNRIIMSPSPLDSHQKIAAELVYQLIGFVKKHNLGEIRFSPYDVHLDDENVYQPDIIFVAKENLHKIKQNGFYGAPELIFEILSPSNATYDLENKKDVYERSGVKEYWIVNPETSLAEGFTLTRGMYESFAKEKQRLALKVLDTVLEF
jgi:Uma2 family endonuclease